MWRISCRIFLEFSKQFAFRLHLHPVSLSLHRLFSLSISIRTKNYLLTSNRQCFFASPFHLTLYIHETQRHDVGGDFIHKMKQKKKTKHNNRKSSKRNERCNLFQHLFSIRCLFGMMWEKEKRWNAMRGPSFCEGPLNDATPIATLSDLRAP